MHQVVSLFFRLLRQVPDPSGGKFKVASTTQNQAFNSLLFFYRHGLKREFGELRDVPRAKIRN
jgi:hypothetical protein